MRPAQVPQTGFFWTLEGEQVRRVYTIRKSCARIWYLLDKVAQRL